MKMLGASAMTLCLFMACADALLPDGIQIGGIGNCPPGRELACTNGFPRSCACTGGPGPLPFPLPFPSPIPLPVPSPQGCSCGSGGSTVCGRNGQSYQNRCVAECLNEEVACVGRCPCPFPNPVPSPRPPSPGGLLTFDLAKCQEAGNSGAVAAARAACTTVKSQCPVRPPQRLAASSAAGLSSASFASVPEQLRRVIEKAIAEICRGIAESTCRNNAESQIRDSDCSKLLSTGPAVSVSGCRSSQDARNIFKRSVDDICQPDD